MLIKITESLLHVSPTVSIPWHVLAGLPPRQASNRTGMSQVDEGEGQLSLDTDTWFWRCEETGNSWLPLTGAIPYLYQAVILNRRQRSPCRICLYRFKPVGCTPNLERPASMVTVTIYIVWPWHCELTMQIWLAHTSHQNPYRFNGSF